MNSIKQTFQRLFLVFPLLALMLAMTSFTNKEQSVQSKAKTSFTHSQTKNDQTLSITDIAVEDIVFNEAENSELDLEFDFTHKLYFENRFLDYTQEPRIKSNKFDFLTANQVLPLYDLFCNWKLNLFS